MATEGTGETVVAPVESAAPATETPGESTPDFSWDSWDGELTSVPDDRRTHVEPVVNFYQNRLKSETERLKKDHDELYRKLLLDPDGVDEIQKLRESVAQLEARERAAQEQADREYARYFRNRYPKVYEDETLRSRVVELIDGDWDPEVAAELAGLSETAFALAKEAKAAGTPDAYALKLAQAHDSKAAPAAVVPSVVPVVAPTPPPRPIPPPSPAASVVHGSGPTSERVVRPRSAKDARSLDEARNIAIDKMFQ